MKETKQKKKKEVKELRDELRSGRNQGPILRFQLH